MNFIDPTVKCSCGTDHVFDETQNYCGRCGSDLKLLHNQEMVGWITFIGIFYLAHFLLFFVAQLVLKDTEPGTLTLVLLFTLAYCIEIGAVLAVMNRYPLFRKTVFANGHVSAAYVGLLLAVFMLAMMYGGMGKLIQMFGETDGNAKSALFITIETVQVVLIAPFLEELFFRGVILPALERYTGFWTALILSSVLFAFAHGFVLAVFIQGVVGLVLGFAYLKTRNIWFCMVLHGVYNAVIQFIMYGL